MTMLEKMKALAAKHHEGQTDKAGKPMMGHIGRVDGGLPADADEEIRCIANGHELIEEGYESRESLFAKGFTARVVNGIDDCARRPGQSPKSYQKQVMANVDAMIVKRSDLNDNSDLTRLKNPTEKDHRRTVYYQSFLRKIDKELKRRSLEDRGEVRPGGR